MHQVVALNKIDVPEAREKQEDLLRALVAAAGHKRVVALSAASREGVASLMTKLARLIESARKLPSPQEAAEATVCASCTHLRSRLHPG